MSRVFRSSFEKLKESNLDLAQMCTNEFMPEGR